MIQDMSYRSQTSWSSGTESPRRDAFAPPPGDLGVQHLALLAAFGRTYQNRCDAWPSRNGQFSSWCVYEQLREWNRHFFGPGSRGWPPAIIPGVVYIDSALQEVDANFPAAGPIGDLIEKFQVMSETADADFDYPPDYSMASMAHVDAANEIVDAIRLMTPDEQAELWTYGRAPSAPRGLRAGARRTTRLDSQ